MGEKNSTYHRHKNGSLWIFLLFVYMAYIDMQNSK